MKKAIRYLFVLVALVIMRPISDAQEPGGESVRKIDFRFPTNVLYPGLYVHFQLPSYMVGSVASQSYYEEVSSLSILSSISAYPLHFAIHLYASPNQKDIKKIRDEYSSRQTARKYSISKPWVGNISVRECYDEETGRETALLSFVSQSSIDADGIMHYFVIIDNYSSRDTRPISEYVDLFVEDLDGY